MTTAAAVQEVDPSTAKKWVDSGEALIVDVREPDERAREWIEGSMPLPLESVGPGSMPAEDGRRIVFQCQSGRRSAVAAARVNGAASRRVFNLTGGIQAWKKAGLAVGVNARAPIPISRQVQIVAGSLVVLGTGLGFFVSPWWLILSAMIGTGLAFSGVSGTCGLAVVLGAMPWNRRISGQGTPPIRVG